MQVLYALALVPVGFLADKADRPRLLSGGLLIWSVLTMVASKVDSCHMGATKGEGEGDTLIFNPIPFIFTLPAYEPSDGLRKADAHV